jgi:hypothetical protein
MPLAARLGLAVLLTATAVSAQSGGGVPAAPQLAASSAVQITGRVTSATDARPLRRALVTVSVGGRLHNKALTDDDGRYQIDAPQGVAYAVVVAKSLYLTTSLQRPAARAGQGTLDVSLARGAVISGRVLDPGGHPVVSIRVQLARTEGTARNSSDISVTDDTGSFRIAGLVPGKYTLTTVANPEYPSGTDPTMRRPINREETWEPSSDAVSVEVTTGTERDVALTYRNPAVVLPYAPVGGAVTGQVTDESGEPGAGLIVQLHRIGVTNGRPVAQPYGAARITDDQGRYRLFHVKAGRYVLVVTDPSSQTADAGVSWLPVYYPGTATPANATALTIGRSQEIGGADVAFTHTQGARVFGTALNTASQPLRSSLSLIPVNSEGALLPSRDMAVGADGTFAFDAVPPGEYAVRANTASSTTVFTPITSGGLAGVSSTSQTEIRDPEFALQRILVADNDVGPLAIRTLLPATLRGRIVFEGGSPIESQPERPPASQGPPGTNALQPGGSPPPVPGPITPRGVLEIVAVTTDPLFDNSGRLGSGAVSTATIDRNTWTFELPRLAGAVRLRLSNAPPNVWLKSAYIGSTNLADTPYTFLSSDDSHDDITIVVASTAGTVTGRTTGDDAQPLAGAHVIVFPTSRERWYIGSPYLQYVYSATDARFTITSLAPGEYYIVAIDSDENELDVRRESERFDLLDSLIPRARRISIGEGQTVTVAPRTVTMGK